MMNSHIDTMLIPRLDNGEMVTVAVSAKWFHFPERFDWLQDHQLAMEYTPDISDLSCYASQLDQYLSKGMLIRHHGFFPGFEFGNTVKEEADEAMALHFKAFDEMAKRGEPFVTCHAGITANVTLDKGRVIENLARLVEYGRKLGITVSLENLRRGLTSDPFTLVEIVEQADSKITMDLGHAVTSEAVETGKINPAEIVKLFSTRLEEIHFYEKETDKHYAPESMAVLAPIVDELLKTQCKWWTIELDEFSDILYTKELVRNYLANRL